MKFFNKKASGMFDTIVIIIFLLVVFFASLLSLFVFTSFNDQFQTLADVDATTKATVQEYGTNWIDIADVSILFWFAILWIGTLVTSFFLFNHPIFYIVFILLSVLSFFALVPFANIVDELCATSVMVTTCAYFPMTTFFIDNIAIVIALFIFSISITLYAKVKSG